MAESVREDREQLAELADLYATRQISARDWLRVKAQVEVRVEAAERRISRLTNTEALTGLTGSRDAVARAWDGLTFLRQCDVVRSVLDHAVIAPGRLGARTLDISRVEPIWRL